MSRGLGGNFKTSNGSQYSLTNCCLSARRMTYQETRRMQRRRKMLGEDVSKDRMAEGYDNVDGE